jgi:hypothetical protein
VYIRKKTFSQRANIYLKSLKSNGYFQYHNYEIYDNGEIKYKGKFLNIADATLQHGVEFGRSSSFGRAAYYTPDEVWIFQKIPGKFFRQRLCIKIKENRDVMYMILCKLAESKGGKIEVIKS